jgi:Ca2+-binding EF-hand superfamily protein
MNSRTSRTLLLASIFALGSAGLASAQPAPGPAPQGAAPHHMHQMHHGQRGDGMGMMGFAMGEAFARADANNDGKVTREEATVWLAARFAEIDANKDGGLTVEEIRVYYDARRGEGRGPPEGMRERMETHQSARFRFVDADLDGKITLPELRVMADAMFRSMDADSDGALTRAELQRRGRRADGPRAQPLAQTPAQPAPR